MEAWSMGIMENLPALICLIVGYALVVVEIWIPGFGVPGIAGIVLMVVGVILKAKNAGEALVLSGILVALVVAALVISMRTLSKGRFARSKIVLEEVSGSKKDEYDLEKYEGSKGVTLTALRPAGMGEFAGEKLNIVSDGEFVPEGARVRVIKVEGNRIVVRADEA